MPITNNASYIPTINEFIAHWTEVNNTLPAPLVVMKPDQMAHSLQSFTGLRNTIEQQANDVIDALNDQEIARGEINLKKKQMLKWINEFVGLLDVYWQGTGFLNARPFVPSESDGQENFASPMRDMASLWLKLNAGTAPSGITLPLLLSDGTDQAAFAQALAALVQTYATEASAEQTVKIRRGKRELSKADAYETMKAYRKAVPSRCAQFPVLVETLPALTAPGGHTPDPVNASAVFQAPDQAKVVYDASADAALERYELRGNPGDTYSDDDAVIIATHAPGDAREFVTGFGLTQPGTTVALKVYVVLTTGNEAGSAVMVVQRPV